MPEWMNIADLSVEQPEKRLHMERYEYAAKMLTGKRVMDCACGMGYGTDILNRGGAITLGMDIDPQAIAEARNRYPSWVYAVGDIYKADFSEADALVSFETLEHLATPHDIIAALPANVKEIVCSVPIRPTVGWNEWHKSDFTKATFREMIEGGGFTLVHEMGQMWVDGSDLYTMLHGRRA